RFFFLAFTKIVILLYTSNFSRFAECQKIFSQSTPLLKSCQMGEDERNFWTTSTRLSTVCWISAAVVYLLKLIRMLLNASSSLTAIAFNTCDGSRSPEVQAEPEESAMSGRLVMISAALMCRKAMKLVFANRKACSPWMMT